MPDVEQIAKGLSEAQRAALVYGRCAKPDGPDDCICREPGSDSLAEIGLAVMRPRLLGGDGAIALTPLGIAVRNHMTGITYA